MLRGVRQRSKMLRGVADFKIAKTNPRRARKGGNRLEAFLRFDDSGKALAFCQAKRAARGFFMAPVRSGAGARNQICENEPTAAQNCGCKISMLRRRRD